MRTFLLLAFITISIKSFSQLSPADKKYLQSSERKVSDYALEIIRGYSPEQRVVADSLFTREFVKLLKTNYSYYYPFDSVITVSILYPPDSSFRIFTWQLVVNENSVRQHGAIQMNTKDGSLKLFPLIDKSATIQNLTDTITSNRAWIGALYYKLIPVKAGDKNIYTLLGYDENNLRTNRKVIEILTFENNEPVFGGNYFVIADGKLQPKPIARYIMEFKRDAGPRLTYDNDLNLIIMEHLISESNEPDKKYTLVGDGDYEGFKWNNGRWYYINKIFNEVTPQGKPPVPNLILDDAGNFDESKMKGGEPAPKKNPKKKN